MHIQGSDHIHAILAGVLYVVKIMLLNNVYYVLSIIQAPSLMSRVRYCPVDNFRNDSSIASSMLRAHAAISKLLRNISWQNLIDVSTVADRLRPLCYGFGRSVFSREAGAGRVEGTMSSDRKFSKFSCKSASVYRR